MSDDRPIITLSTEPGGWPPPWLTVAELATALPDRSWTLVGGLMVQLHTLHRGLGVVRPTNDIDIVVHVETSRGIPNAVAIALERLTGRKLNSRWTC